jgi:transmembrane sensor
LAGAAAALALVVVGVSLFWAPLHRAKNYQAEIGQVRTVALEDGSRVSLDTGAQVDVSLGAHERRIELIRGDAYFEVAKDAARPFVVRLAGARVIAVGTQFYVGLGGEDLVVLVSEGAIRLEPASGTSQDAAAGSEAHLSASGIHVSHPTDGEVEELLGWRSGYLLFRDSTLTDAVDRFNRYTTKRLVIQDPSIGAIRIGGHFRIDDVTGFLWLLKSAYPIDIDERDDRILLTRRAG